MDFTTLLRAKPFVAQHLKKDFAAFCRAAWPVLHPGSRLNWTRGHDLIAEHLVAVWQGRTKRLIVNCPPRFGKSTILNCFAVWVWLQDPSKSFLACSYEIDLALNGNADRRKLMESRWFQALFGDVFTLSSDRSQAGDFSNTAGGSMQAASTNSRAQGRGGHYILLDDPNSADTIHSEAFRNETNFWLENMLPQRLNDPTESAIVLVQQRLHQNDCTGFLLSQPDSEWTLLALPLIAEEDTLLEFPISGKIWRRRAGDCLDPKRWSPRTVRERQRNRLVFAGQFQQSPMAAEGNLVRVDDILFYGGRDPHTGAMDPGLPESFERKIISVDCSFKDKAGSDYVGMLVIGINGARRYVLHIINCRMDLTSTENEIRSLRAIHSPVSAILVEDAANGPSVVNHLRDEIPGIVLVRPEGGKMSRLVATAGEFQAGNWVFDRNGVWTSTLVTQLVMFPNARHDDLSDCLSQASVWLQANRDAYGLLEYGKKMLAEVAAGVRNVYGDVIHPKPKPAAAATPAPATPAPPRPEASSKPKPELLPFCSKCKTVRLVKIGSMPGRDLHCNTCGSDHDREGNLIAVPATSEICPNGPYAGAPHDWRLVSGSRRCIHCGEQRGGNEPTNGWPRNKPPGRR